MKEENEPRLKSSDDFTLTVYSDCFVKDMISRLILMNDVSTRVLFSDFLMNNISHNKDLIYERKIIFLNGFHMFSCALALITCCYLMASCLCT